MVVAYVLLVTEVGRKHEVADQIKKMPGVAEIAITYGSYDLVFNVACETMADLDKVVTQSRKIPGVDKTSTLIWAI